MNRSHWNLILATVKRVTWTGHQKIGAIRLQGHPYTLKNLHWAVFNWHHHPQKPFKQAHATICAKRTLITFITVQWPFVFWMTGFVFVCFDRKHWTCDAVHMYVFTRLLWVATNMTSFKDQEGWCTSFISIPISISSQALCWAYVHKEVYVLYVL